MGALCSNLDDRTGSWIKMNDAEGQRDEFVEILDLVSEVKRLFSRAGHSDFELKILVVPEKPGGNRLQSGGRIAPAKGFPSPQNLKRLIQKNGLADFSPKVESQDHSGFLPLLHEVNFHDSNQFSEPYRN